jgi:NAD(P)H-nitrite reductase large subunit
MRYVIVGGGVAGTTAAEELRKLDPESEITLICEEQHPLYSRVLLGHYVQDKVERERVFLKKEEWYAEQKIEWLCGEVVQSHDAKNKFVALHSGREIEYDKLLIATGKEVRPIPDDLRGVMYFRTIDDADHIKQLMLEMPKDGRAVIYGGGFIACEYLNLFAHRGIATTLAFRGNHFWNRLLESDVGELINDHLRAQGVDVQPLSELQELEGEKELERVVTASGTYECNVLGVGIGLKSDFLWLDESLDTNVGIKTNEFLETNLEDVYAAGDVAEFNDVVTGRQMTIGTWMNAISQGRCVAKNMFGEKTGFRLVSSYAMKVLGLDIIFVGDVEISAADEIKLVGSKEAGGITQLFGRDGRVVGAVIVGRNSDRKVVTAAIDHQKQVEEVILELE